MIKQMTVTLEDYNNFIGFCLARIKSAQPRSLKCFIVSALAWAGVTCIFFFMFRMRDIIAYWWSWPTALIAALATAIPFIIYFYFIFSHFRHVEKVSTPEEHGLILGKKVVEFDAHGIKDTTIFGCSTYKWEGVKEIVEHSGSVYLFLDTMLAQIIPSSVFANREELNAFIAHIKNLQQKVILPTENKPVL